MASGKSDTIKGRAKEAAGALTDDDKLRREGRLDQAVGKIKEKTSEAIDKARDLVSGKKGKPKGPKKAAKKRS